jgi:hypothetical protein
MPPASGNGKFAVLERRKRFGDLYLRGESQWQIAHGLGVGQATISRDLETMREQWRVANALVIDALQHRSWPKSA